MKFGPTAQTIWQINLRFVFALILYGLAWLYWPSSPEWWFFKVLAVMMIIAATIEVIKNLVRIWMHLWKDRDVAKYSDLGETAKGDQLANYDAERRAGMHDL